MDAPWNYRKLKLGGSIEQENKKSPKKFLNLEQKKTLIFVSIFAFLFGGLGGFFGIEIYKEVKGIKSVIQGFSTQNLTLKENSAVIDVVEKVSPSVVSITGEQNRLDFFGQVSKSKSSGTGFILTEDGLMITNKHVVADDEATYFVFTADGKEYEAEVKAKDPLNDIAFLKLKGAKGLKPVILGNSEDLKVGQQVVAIGNALGQYQNTVTSGVISAKGRAVPVGEGGPSSIDTLENVLQTDAAINPGNSGGPLVNLAGQVVGINTAIDASGQSIGFAIPIDMVKNAIKSVEAKGKVIRPYIGIKYIPITKEFATRNNLKKNNGVLVYGGQGELGVVPDSPASKAGIKENDIILKINGKGIDIEHTLIGLLQNYSPGDSVKITLFRENKEMVLDLRLGESK